MYYIYINERVFQEWFLTPVESLSVWVMVGAKKGKTFFIFKLEDFVP